MKKFLAFVLFFFSLTASAHAFWIWTPETNKWENPRFSVKDTPKQQLDFALEIYKTKDWEKTLREFRKLVKHYPKSREAAEAQYYIGQVLEQQGDLMQAFKEYQVVVDRYPFSERAGDIVKLQYEIGNQLMEGKDKQNRIITAVTGRDYDVIEIYRRVIKNSPYGEFAAASQYKIGLYLQEKGLFQEARDEFEKTANDYPDSEWAKAAKYQIAVSDAKRSKDPQHDQKVTQIAIQQFEDFVKENPDAAMSQDAHGQIQKLKEKEAENNFLIAQFYEKQKKYDAAKVYYAMIVDNYKTTSWAQKALEKIRKLETK